MDRNKDIERYSQNWYTAPGAPYTVDEWIQAAKEAAKRAFSWTDEQYDRFLAEMAIPGGLKGILKQNPNMLAARVWSDSPTAWPNSMRDDLMEMSESHYDELLSGSSLIQSSKERATEKIPT